MYNLKLAFPKKSEDELTIIHKNFFKYFTDFLVESLKTITISKKEILKRYHFNNIEVINKLYQKDKNIVLMMAHYGNWEWMISLPLNTKIDSYAVYTKVNNIHFEKLVKNYRSKFGMLLIKASQTIKTILKNHHQKKQGLFILASDQSPQLHKTFYWRNFFNNRVPVHIGSDLIAQKYNYAVVNANITRIKRGFYEVDLELITENAEELPKNKVIDIYTDLIEKHISKQPEFYLWSHRRFKHMGKEPKPNKY